MSERTSEYSSPEARAHEPTVGIADGYASMPAAEWVAYANLSNGFFLALLRIANAQFEHADEYALELRAIAQAALPKLKEE